MAWNRNAQHALAAFLTLTLFSACRTTSTSDVKEAPSGDSALHWWGLQSIRFDDLPMEKTLPKVPWPGDYWATYQGGISYRWQDPNDSEDFRDYLYEIPKKQDVDAMSDDEVNKLSPSEKYDLWVGRTDWTGNESATGRQRKFMEASAAFNNNTEIPTWTGICNGWSLAAIYEDAPIKPVTVKNAEGRPITFYPGDIKALMSQIYFDYQPGINVARLGSLCDEATPARNNAGRITAPQCRDTNPASFHIALAKYLAEGKPFVFDVEPAEETWNQPVYGYKMKLGAKKAKPASYRNAAAGTVNIVPVTVDLSYIVEAYPEKKGMTEAETKRHIKKKRYSYFLELDQNDMVLGGEWKKNSAVPDFLWRPDERPTDQILQGLPGGYPISYTGVSQLLAASTGQATTVTIPNTPIDDPSQNDPNAPVQSAVTSCKSCILTLAPGGLVGRSNAGIKNLIRKAFVRHLVFPFIRANDITTDANSVVVPVRFVTAQDVAKMKEWLAAEPFKFELKAVTEP